MHLLSVIIYKNLVITDSHDYVLQALPLYLDKLVNEFVAIFLSVTFVLFFGEVSFEAKASILSSFLKFSFVNLSFSFFGGCCNDFLGYPTSYLLQIRTSCWGEFRVSRAYINADLLSSFLPHWKGTNFPYRLLFPCMFYHVRA